MVNTLGTGTGAKLDRTTEERSWSPQGGDPLLVAALAAALVEYRHNVGQRNGDNVAAKTGSNWRVATRVAQLQQLP